MKIDCTECEMYRTEHCDDCLVTAVLHAPGSPVEIDEEVEAPLGAFAEAGLIPVLKFRPRDAPAGDDSAAGAARDTG